MALVSGQGFVVPGKKSLGLLCHKAKYYSVSRADRAVQFGRNPDMFVRAIERLVHEHPCLLKLLDMSEEEKTMSSGRNKVVKEVVLKHIISQITLVFFSCQAYF